MRDGECVKTNTDPNVFQPDKPAGHITREYDKAVAKALAVCARCTVRQQCADYAIDNNENTGIWGMMTAEQRIRERLRRRIK